jgi:oligopeptide/dipeptide ABC transporter ATP-binding protein
VKPLHPYTKSLLSSIPVANPHIKIADRRIMLKGDVGSPINPKPGCRFAPRCRYAQDRCRIDTPELREILPGHLCACHYAETIQD